MTTHGIVRLLGRVRGLLRQHESLADVKEAIGIVNLIRDEIAVEASAIVRQAGADAYHESQRQPGDMPRVGVYDDVQHRGHIK
jgi:hypothetical protein